jgi:hypothetical protein
VQCLFQTRNYHAGVDKVRQFLSTGAAIPELVFLHGLCLYHLGEYDRSAEIFSERPEWHRWAQKSIQKRDPKRHFVIPIGDRPPRTLETPPVVSAQTSTTISIVVPLPGLHPDYLAIEAGPSDIRFEYNDGVSAYRVNWILHAAVVPETLTYDVKPQSVDIAATKAIEAEWPTIMKTDRRIPEGDRANEMQARLERMPDLESPLVASSFEGARGLAKEEGVDMSSWFVD